MDLQKRQLVVSDLDELVMLDKSIRDNLRDKQQYANVSRSEFEKVLCGNGIALGIFDSDKMIGFCIFLFPGDDEENLGYDIGLPKEELAYVIHMEIGAVLQQYRSLGLVTDMVDELFEKVKKEEKFRYFFSTVHPFNIASLRIQFKFGLKIYALKEKYGGVIRYIFMRDLKNSNEQKYSQQKIIDCCDFESQIFLLTDGFVGIGLVENDEDFIIFAK